jgi:S-phase kinase-associated protein 1
MATLIAQEGCDGTDGFSFNVSLEACNLSDLMKSVIEDAGDDAQTEIPLPNVPSNVLEKIVEFMQCYTETPMSEIEKPLKSPDLIEVVGEKYANLVNIDQELLIQMMGAADYMGIQSLLDLTCAKVASIIHGKTPSELRKMFNLENDFTLEEERKLCKEIVWCE